MQQKKELNWVNAAKALCMIAVLFVHTENYYGMKLGEVNLFICGFYVNAFFMISGYLLFKKQLTAPAIGADCAQCATGGGKSLIYNILFRIYIPMVIFSAIEYFPKIAIAHRPFAIDELILETIGAGTYWFTSALLIAEILIALLLLTRQKSVWFYVVMLGLVSAAGMYLYDKGVFRLYREPFFVSRGTLACLFLGLGAVYWKYESTFDKIVCKYTILPLLALYIYLGYFSPTTPRFMVSMGDMDALGYFYGFLGSVLLVWFCKRLPELKPVTFIGRNSICFYFMSGALPITLSVIAKRIHPEQTIYMLMLVFVLTLFISYIVSMVIVRYLPWLLDFRKIKK